MQQTGTLYEGEQVHWEYVHALCQLWGYACEQAGTRGVAESGVRPMGARVSDEPWWKLYWLPISRVASRITTKLHILVR